MKTTEVRKLVREVLDTLPKPYTEHVIDDVLYAIETTPVWRRRYEALCSELTIKVVNNWCGQWVAEALGKVGETQVPRRRSTLVGSYSLLDTDAKTVKRKPKEDEARQIMFDHYRANKATLPADIQKNREAILQLIMDGKPVQEAFEIAQRLSNP